MKSIIAVLVIFTLLLAIAVFQVTANDVACQSNVMDAATAIYVEPGASKQQSDAIASAFQSKQCIANKTFGSLVSSIVD